VIVRRASRDWGNVPEYVKVALTAPDVAVMVAADASGAATTNEASTIAAMSPD
jgi:hypothetical protein